MIRKISSNLDINLSKTYLDLFRVVVMDNKTGLTLMVTESTYPSYAEADGVRHDLSNYIDDNFPEEDCNVIVVRYDIPSPMMANFETITGILKKQLTED